MAQYAYIGWALLQIPQGIRGHVLELMALIEFVKKHWPDTDDVSDNELPKWQEDLGGDLFGAVSDLCAAFDDLVETHRKAHMLTGNVSDVSLL